MSDESNDESTTLLEDVSPNGNVTALVEATRDVVYFYLSGLEETGLGIRSVWVRNLRPAPATLKKEDMERGVPPMLPAPVCAHPNGARLPEASKLRIVWFEEGDAAALLEGDELLAAIPSWSGINGFDGYARDCTGEGPLAWPLKEATAIYDRVARAEAFWRSWEPGHAHWPQVQEAFLDEYERVFGKHTKYWGIDGGKWPPKAIALFETDQAMVLLTLGVSIRPMPRVEMSHEDPASHRRVELGVAIDRRLASEQVVADVARYISAQSNLPWTFYTWLGHGHTVQCEPCPVGGDFAAMLLLKHPPGAPAVAMPNYRGDPVNLLWMTPIAPAEWQLAQVQSGGELFDRLRSAGAVWPHRQRASVV